LDFFESALAFMAGYGLKAFLIAQSLNQIEKAYGQNNSILDNCHVRVSFATNDERTAKRVSDALGTATEMRAMRNYAGNRLSPWLGHLMVSRQETARPLLTPGEIMQLPPDDEIVMISSTHPIRAKKARYFEDTRLAERVLPPPKAGGVVTAADQKADDWTKLPLPEKAADLAATPEQPSSKDDGKTMPRNNDDPTNAGIRREPELPDHEDIEPAKPALASEFVFEDGGEEPDDETFRLAEMRRQMGGVARQASLDPADDLGL
jgi:type IV secretion system protein VirD4